MLRLYISSYAARDGTRAVRANASWGAKTRNSRDTLSIEVCDMPMGLSCEGRDCPCVG